MLGGSVLASALTTCGGGATPTGSGSTTGRPTTSTTTTAPPGGVTLGPDVLGIVRVGDAQVAAVAAMTLSTRRTRHGRGPRLARRPRAHHCSALLSTATGATFAMTLAKGRALYPATDLTHEEGGSIVVPGVATGDRMLLLFVEDLPSTPHIEIKDGQPRGDV